MQTVQSLISCYPITATLTNRNLHGNSCLQHNIIYQELLVCFAERAELHKKASPYFLNEAI